MALSSTRWAVLGRGFAILVVLAGMLMYGLVASAQDLAADGAGTDAVGAAGTGADEPNADGWPDDPGSTIDDGDAVADAVPPEVLLEKRIHEVGTGIDTLKEDTFTTKSRLLLLREEVLQRSVTGARLQLRHRYDMGGQFALVKMFYSLDRETVYARQDPSGSLGETMNDKVLYDRMLAPGAHQLTVIYVYRGRPWGLFRYMEDYTFRVESGYDFIVDEGKAAELVVTAAEAGNAFTAYEQRPTVKYDLQQYELTPGKVVRDGQNGTQATGAPASAKRQ